MRPLLLNNYLSKIDPELRDYIEVNIFPQYSQNDVGHQLDHIQYVIQRSFQFTDCIEKHDKTHLNYNIIYVAAAYHDLGHHIDPGKHEEISAQILQDDSVAATFLAPDELQTAIKSIRDHRSSSSGAVRDIYGKILVSADCNINNDAMLRRTYAYRIQNFPSLNLDEIIESSRQHLIDKYGEHGYALDKMYFPDPEFTQALQELRRLTANPQRFRSRYLRVNNLE